MHVNVIRYLGQIGKIREVSRNWKNVVGEAKVSFQQKNVRVFYVKFLLFLLLLSLLRPFFYNVYFFPADVRAYSIFFSGIYRNKYCFYLLFKISVRLISR